MYSEYIIFSLLTKCICRPDEMASRAGFGLRALVRTLETPVLD